MGSASPSCRPGSCEPGSCSAAARLWNVSSTSRGGGVAEPLLSPFAYARGARVDARWRWRVISGDRSLFDISTRIHNRLHGFPGDGGPPGDGERERYEAALAPNAEALAAEIRP
jgi:trehalose synthase